MKNLVICCGPCVIDHRLLQVYVEDLLYTRSPEFFYNPIFDEKNHLKNRNIKPNKTVHLKKIRTVINQPKGRR